MIRPTYDLFSVHKILTESRSDIQFSDFRKRSIGRKYYQIDNWKGFCFIADNNEIGFYIKKQYQHNGLATKAASELIAKEVRPYYFATIKDSNSASQKVIEKLGFKPKGTLWGLDRKV